MLVRHYEWAGYDVLAITDHWVRTVERSTRKLLVIPSTELNAHAPTPEHDAHVLALGRRGRPGAARGRVRAARRRSSPGSWTTAAFPTSRTRTGAASAPSSGGTATACSGSRSGTRGCELEIGRGDASIHWDEALERGRPLFALATDDSHHPGYDSGFAWTMVRAAEQHAGRRCSTHCAPAFYGSTGPEIHDVELDDGDVVVRCSPAQSVTLYSRPLSRRARERRPARLSEPRRRSSSATDDGLITAVRLERPYAAPFGRIEVLDAARRRRPGRTRCGPRRRARAARPRGSTCS